MIHRKTWVILTALALLDVVVQSVFGPWWMVVLCVLGAVVVAGAWAFSEVAHRRHRRRMARFDIRT